MIENISWKSLGWSNRGKVTGAVSCREDREGAKTAICSSCLWVRKVTCKRNKIFRIYLFTSINILFVRTVAESASFLRRVFRDAYVRTICYLMKFITTLLTMLYYLG
jgi:hypothetical protein